VGTGLDFTLITDDPSFHAGQGNHPRKYYDNIYAKIPKKRMMDFQRIRALPCDTQSGGHCRWLTYKEVGFPYRDLSSVVASCIKNDVGLELNGFFQSERYFASMSAGIKELFTPVGGLISTVRTTTDLFNRFPELDPETPSDGLKRCFLGVRRGDYCKNTEMISYHNPCSLDYYKRSMDHMKADIYYVMSDDISWCRENFQGPQFRFLDEPDDLISFYFARLFSNYICANSSFHWWGSYLSLNPAPIVIVPAEHFGPTATQDYKDYFRAEMIRISNHSTAPIDITVCVPLYNGIEFLSETVASIQAQTYPHWNCIIGVNGHGITGGNVFRQAQALVNGDARFRVINYPTASSVADVDNLMRDDAMTEWIAHVDANDVWLPEKLAAQVAALQGPAIGADIIGTDCCYFGARDGKPAIKTGWITAHDLAQENHIINSATLLKKSVANYSNRFYGCEDYDLWLRSALAGQKIYNLPDVLVRHRIHSQSHFNTSKKQNPNAVKSYYDDREEAFTLVTAFYEMRSKFPSSQYMEWIRSFFIAYNGHMVIYTDTKYQATFTEWRTPYADRTRIIVAPQESWEATTNFPQGFWEKQHMQDHEKDRHSPNLYMIWYQKNSFVQRTIRDNPFSHQKFMWCDVGVVRNLTLQSWASALPNHGHRILTDKMTVLEIQPFQIEEREASLTNLVDFTLNKNRIGGGVLAGGTEAWCKWGEHYATMMREFVEAGLFVGKDQNLFANMVLRWPADVHVVSADPRVGADNYWFYLLYYFSCGPREFLTTGASPAKVGQPIDEESALTR
jgi:glycosyltransferase involved in cell wall biosynthesis